MKILIWGVSCVGKTTVGSLLAKKLNYKFIDLNDEIKKRYKTINNFYYSFLSNYSMCVEKTNIILDIIKNNDNFVLTITEIYYKRLVDKILKTDTVSVELIDSVESIYERILFYDDNDELEPDSIEYRDKHRDYYLKDIKQSKLISNKEYKNIPKFDINNRKLGYIIDELADYIFEYLN